MLRATGASEATVCRLSISLPCRANSTKRCEKIVAQRVADVAGDAKRAAVVQERLGRVLFRRVGEQAAEVGHQLPLRFAELAQLPRTRRTAWRAPSGSSRDSLRRALSAAARRVARSASACRRCCRGRSGPGNNCRRCDKRRGPSARCRRTSPPASCSPRRRKARYSSTPEASGVSVKAEAV